MLCEPDEPKEEGEEGQANEELPQERTWRVWTCTAAYQEGGVEAFRAVQENKR